MQTRIKYCTSACSFTFSNRVMGWLSFGLGNFRGGEGGPNLVPEAIPMISATSKICFRVSGSATSPLMK
eukprot:2264902-Amphidinium_carterae.1